MKGRIFSPIISLLVIMAVFMSGCKLSTTIVVTEQEYDVRLVNKSGNKVKVRWDEGSYRYIDDGNTIVMPAGCGYYELEWEEVSSGRHTKPAKVFRIDIEADIDIVFQDDPDIIIIER